MSGRADYFGPCPVCKHMICRCVPVPDYRDLARRLAEALREHRNCAVIQSREDGRFVCTFCGATAARKYVEHGYSCRHAKDRRLLAEAKEKLGEGK